MATSNKSVNFCHELLLLILREMILHRKNYISYRTAKAHFQLNDSTFSMRMKSKADLLTKMGVHVCRRQSTNEKLILLDCEAFSAYVKQMRY